MAHPQTKCPAHAAGCTHYLNEHSVRGGCMHRKPTGAICGCTYTSGAAQGANPFSTIQDVTTVAQQNTPRKREPTMSAVRLFNIADVAAELNVTPQRASAWHRGPDATPEPSFIVSATELELWTADDVTLWSDWVEKQEADKKAAKEAKAAKAAPAPEPAVEMPQAEDVSIDVPSPEASEDIPGETAPAGSRGKNAKTA